MKKKTKTPKPPPETKIEDKIDFEKLRQRELANILKKLQEGKSLTAGERALLEEFEAAKADQAKPQPNQPAKKRKMKEGAKDKRQDPEVKRRLLSALETGHTYKTSVALAGIAEGTFYRWMQEGEAAPEGDFKREFCEEIKRAEFEAMDRNVKIIQKAARTGKNWTASAWLLERRHPEQWGRYDRSEVKATIAHSGEVKGDSGVRLEDLSLETRKAILADIRRKEETDAVPKA